MAPRKIIITTDPGQDQAVALFMAFARPDLFDILGMVATAGNIDLSYTVGNCLKLLELAGRPEIPVFAGCVRPIRRNLVTAAHVHGPTGLDGYDFPAPRLRARQEHGVDFIIETLKAAEPGEITIFSLSPLTNLGMALIEAPEIAPKIREIVMMAGAYFEVGNITPTAEFNVYVDPDAADVVLRSGIPMVMLPLDVTHRVLTTRARVEGLPWTSSPLAAISETTRVAPKRRASRRNGRSEVPAMGARKTGVPSILPARTSPIRLTLVHVMVLSQPGRQGKNRRRSETAESAGAIVEPAPAQLYSAPKTRERGADAGGGTDRGGRAGDAPRGGDPEAVPRPRGLEPGPGMGPCGDPLGRPGRHP